MQLIDFKQEVSDPQPVTREKILRATLLCLERWGAQKTSLNDIAREAGVTRPTVYSYFNNKEDVIQEALLQVGVQFGEKLLAHFAQFETPEERLLQAALFTLKNLPQEPYLGLAMHGDMAQQINERAVSSVESHGIRLELFKEILKSDPRYIKELEEISEVTTRFLLSLLVVEGPVKRDEEQMREFLTKRLLPSLGMSL